MTDFGTDITVTPDLDFALVTGRAVVIQAVVRRLLTPSGSLFYAPSYGIDLRGLLNASYTTDTLARWKSEIERQAEADDRVASCTATIAASGQTVKISVAVELVDGTVAAVDLVSRASPVVGAAAAASADATPADAFDVIPLYF